MHTHTHAHTHALQHDYDQSQGWQQGGSVQLLLGISCKAMWAKDVDFAL